MTIKLPRIIEQYVNASNAHDVISILSCFLDTATVRDEARMRNGKKEIESWIVETIQKYKFHFKPLSVKMDDSAPVVTIEVSGTFDGSPVNLNYRFILEDEKIRSLEIE